MIFLILSFKDNFLKREIYDILIKGFDNYELTKYSATLVHKQ